MNLLYLTPYFIVVATVLVILLLDAFSASNTLINIITVVGLVTSAKFSHTLFELLNGGSLYVANSMLKIDSITLMANITIEWMACIVIIANIDYVKFMTKKIGEYYSIFMIAILGMMVMTASTHVLMLYLGLETLSLSLLGLIVFSQNSKSIEAAMKFFILNAIASSIVLLGISFLYLATNGCLYIGDIAHMISNNGINLPITTLACLFILTGVLFKFGVFPFHSWVPDVYQASPYNTVLLVGTISKIAATIFAIRFIVIGFYSIIHLWQPIILTFGILSVAFGNIVALSQKNIKRILGYSAIANAGFIVVGFSLGTIAAIGASMFYAIAYALSLTVALIVLMVMSHKNIECENLSQLQGFYKQSKFLAFTFVLAIFSIGGIPPMVGFFAKLGIIQELVSNGWYKYTVALVLLSLIGAFVYLRIIKTIYFMEPTEEQAVYHKPSILVHLMLTKCVFLLIFISVYPKHILNIVLKALGVF